MDPHRSSYQEESEPRWFTGEPYGDEAGWERRGDPRYAEPRPGHGGWGEPGHQGMPPPPGPPGHPGQMGPPGPIGPRSGEPLPPLPSDMPPREQPPPMRRPAGANEGIYRARRPAAAIVLSAACVLLALPALRMLLSAVFGDTIVPGAVVAGSFVLLGLPLGAMGLYGLVTGAARVPGPAVHAWLRPPLAYLAVALVLFVAAGLAAA